MNAATAQISAAKGLRVHWPLVWTIAVAAILSTAVPLVDSRQAHVA